MQRTTINREVPTLRFPENKPFLPELLCLLLRLVSPPLIVFFSALCPCTCQAYPGLPLRLCTNNCSSSLCVFACCGWDCLELFQESRPDDNLGCLYCH
ncbi:hypothetical protein BDW60DRAFT_194955 [Aspergillus nidulans var. acristatus]